MKGGGKVGWNVSGRLSGWDSARCHTEQSGRLSDDSHLHFANDETVVNSSRNKFACDLDWKNKIETEEFLEIFSLQDFWTFNLGSSPAQTFVSTIKCFKLFIAVILISMPNLIYYLYIIFFKQYLIIVFRPFNYFDILF